jgi:GntR family transcriptional regulator
MAIRFNISPGSQSPIYRQIIDQARLAIATGKAQPGDPLPSVRALAEELVVNPNTIAKAYSQLAAEGLIETQPGKGVFFAAIRQVYSQAERARRIDHALETFIQEALCLGLTSGEARALFESKLNRLAPEDKK